MCEFIIIMPVGDGFCLYIALLFNDNLLNFINFYTFKAMQIVSEGYQLASQVGSQRQVARVLIPILW